MSKAYTGMRDDQQSEGMSTFQIMAILIPVIIALLATGGSPWVLFGGVIWAGLVRLSG